MAGMASACEIMRPSNQRETFRPNPNDGKTKQKSINKSHENQSLRKKINMKEPTYMLFVVSLLRKHIGK